ncbi:MAG: hypothetical protein M3Q45_15535 [Chloroflexota bacterium]|nr:hypothetical protein [Chloroflexota bacterium]
MTKLTLFLATLILMLLTGCTPLIVAPATDAQAEAWLIVRIGYPSTDSLNQLAAELDIWEVDRAEQSLVARVTIAQYQALLNDDLTMQVDCPKMKQYASALGVKTQVVQAILQQSCPQP